MNWRIFLMLFIPYVPIRLSSCLANPRPYLLWHGVLDLVVISAYVFVGIASRERANKCVQSDGAKSPTLTSSNTTSSFSYTVDGRRKSPRR